MVFISVTRLRIRSWLYMPQFIWHTLLSNRQVRRSPGFINGLINRESNNAFWTLTAWNHESEMRAYRSAGAHLKAMPKLLNWCDEASVAHWEQESVELPSWSEAHQKMATQGRMSKVKHPSDVQVAKVVPRPAKPGREGQHLKPIPPPGSSSIGK